MPPKAKYTKQQIADAAYDLVRSEGFEHLSARSLAARLDTSTAPIFTAFNGIEEVQQLCIERAKELYGKYLRAGLESPIPFKGAGLKYIEFAKTEPRLFRLLFMSGDSNKAPTHFFPADDENTAAVLKAITAYRFSEERARSLYNHLSVYAHGLAVIFAQGHNVFTMEDASKMLSEIFMSLTKGEYGE